MIPTKVLTQIDSLLEDTKKNELKWAYRDTEGMVSTSDNRFDITITYSHDPDEGHSQFMIQFFDKNRLKNFIFSCTQYDAEYDTVRELFDWAQSTDIEF